MVRSVSRCPPESGQRGRRLVTDVSFRILYGNTSKPDFPLCKFALAFFCGIWYTLIYKRKDGESSVANGMAAERNPTAERVLPLRAREVHSGAVPLKVTVGGNGCGFVTGRQSVCFCAKIRGGTAEPKLRPMEGRGFFILLKGC